jgi:uncharacterized repeat protein (TIGR01451 family)
MGKLAERGDMRLPRGRRTRLWAALALAIPLGAVATAQATHLPIDTEGHTTLEQIFTCTTTCGDNFKTLSLQQVNDNYIVRPAGGVTPDPGRAQHRRSLAYLSQLTDFQLADEESPARVEFLDVGANSAWRPQEALQPFIIDASIRQIDRFSQVSPVPQGDGLGGNSMDFSLITGDQADNQQRNEMLWTRELLEGGQPLVVGSGVPDPNFYDPTMNPDILTTPSCPAFVAQEGSFANAAAEGTAYTGVQDYTDYPTGAPPGLAPLFYDPNTPTGPWAAWPTYTGLMDRAQATDWTFTPVGLDVPSYWVNGNHDVLVQGNEDANAAYEDIATACFKALGTTATPGSFPDGPDPNVLLFPSSPGMLVPPDPLRRFVSKPQIKAIIGENNQGAGDDNHGFDYVDADEDTASKGSASYYSWDPVETPGLRFIAIDTNSEGGVLGPFGPEPTGSSNGNLDDPQFQWLKAELDQAQADAKLVVLFGHHPVRTLNADIPDETASPCTGVMTNFGDTPEHDVNPGCDPDPRLSEPLHFGDAAQAQQFGSTDQTFTQLLDQYPNVVAYVAGHTHEHKLIPFTRPDGTAWWEINSSATADWPQQHRLVEIMDNRDGTLSIFGTVLDFASPSGAPNSGTPAAAFDVNDLASVGRSLGYNDPQTGPPTGEGEPEDRNAEMVIPDPRKADLKVTKSDAPDPVMVGDELTYTVTVTNDGLFTATGTTLTDDLSATAEFVSATPSVGACPTTPGLGDLGGEVSCDLGDILNGDSVTVTITVTPRTSGTITNQAGVDGILDDPNPANNTDSAQTTVTPIPTSSADLSISKTASPSSLTVGQELTYSIGVTNKGPDSAPGVAITDNLPAGVALGSATASQGNCSSSSGVVTCVLGALASGASATAQIKVTPQASGTALNQATAASGVGDPIAANNAASARAQVNAPPSPPTASRESLRVNFSPNRTRPHRRSCFVLTVTTATGQPVPDTIVKIGWKSRKTDANGQVRICRHFKKGGRSVPVTAEKTGFDAASSSLRVRRR